MAARCCVHTHSTFCDGDDSLATMAAAAYAAGVRYFGASGHSHTPIPADAGNVLDADLTAYRAEVLRLREEYLGRMEVLLGLEWDSCSDAPAPPDLDYWIGSVHDLHDSAGHYYPVDWRAEDLTACRDAVFDGDMMALLSAYFTEVARVAALKPTILGHLDLVTKLNGAGDFFDESDPAYKQMACAALHAADPKRTLLEINTGAMARGYRTAPYPAPFLLTEWRRMGGEVILTDDAHAAKNLAYGYDKAAEAARAAGFSRTMLLTMEGLQAAPL